MCAHCPFTFKDVEVGCLFPYFMNNRIQTELPLKMIHVSLIHVIVRPVKRDRAVLSKDTPLDISI